MYIVRCAQSKGTSGHPWGGAGKSDEEKDLKEAS